MSDTPDTAELRRLALAGATAFRAWQAEPFDGVALEAAWEKAEVALALALADSDPLCVTILALLDRLAELEAEHGGR